MSQSLTEGIYGMLTANQGAGTFYSDLGGRIYEMVSPEEAALPLMVFNLITDPPDERFASDDILATIQIDLYGERRLGSEVLGDIQTKILANIDGASPTISGYTGGVFEFTERGARSIDGDAIRIRMEGTVSATAT